MLKKQKYFEIFSERGFDSAQPPDIDDSQQYHRPRCLSGVEGNIKCGVTVTLSHRPY